MFIILSFYLFSFDLADEFDSNTIEQIVELCHVKNPHPAGNMKYTGSQTEY